MKRKPCHRDFPAGSYWAASGWPSEPRRIRRWRTACPDRSDALPPAAAGGGR